MAAATSSHSPSPYSSHWGARGATPSYYTPRSDPIAIPDRSAPRSSGSSSNLRHTMPSSSSSRDRKSAHIIYPSSSWTYLDGNGSPRSPNRDSYRPSSSGYTSRRSSGAYSVSPSSQLVGAKSSPPTSSSLKRTTSNNNNRRSSVSFAEAPIVLNESPTRERFERKYNVECLQSARSVVDALANVTITNSSTRRRRGSSGSPPSPSRLNEIHVAKLKDGMTTLPRSLVGKEAVEQLGYESEVTKQTITIFKALSKDQIDCLIALTESLRKKESKRTDRQTVIVLEPERQKQTHHFSPKKSETCQTPHQGGCTAACFSKDAQQASCDCKDCRI